MEIHGGLLDREHRALTTGIVALATLIGFEYLAVATAMPAVAQALDGLRLYPLAFGAPLAASVVGMVVSGRHCDRRGPRAPLWGGIGVFVLGLLLAAAATTMAQLLLGRFVQGLGGGLLSVALYVVVGRTYRADLQPRIFAALALAWVLPVIAGPALAGVIVDRLGWRWVFLAAALLAPAAALVLGLGLRGRPLPALPDAPRQRPRQLAWALGAAASAGLLYYAGQQRGLDSLLLLPALAGLLACLPGLLPAGTLRLRRGLPTVIALRGIAAAAFLGAEVFIPLLLTQERGLSLTRAGLVLTAGALGWSAGSWWQGRQPAGVAPLRWGMALIAGGIGGVMLLLVPALPLGIGLAGWILAGVGMGVVYPTLSVLTLQLSPPALQGRNSAALQLSDALFSVIALGLSGALFAALAPGSLRPACAAGLSLAALLALGGAAVAGRGAPAAAD